MQKVKIKLYNNQGMFYLGNFFIFYMHKYNIT